MAVEDADQSAKSKPQPQPVPRPAKPLDRDPVLPSWISGQGRVLDPGTALVTADDKIRPTVYVGSQLLISNRVDVDAVLRLLEPVAADLGWRIELEPEEDHIAKLPFGVRAVRLQITPTSLIAPDAWTLLRQAMARFGADEFVGVSLDHVLGARTLAPSPLESSHPLESSLPLESSHPAGSAAAQTYARPGWGGRQPIAYVGPKPTRRDAKALPGRRPVVAILDTGCYADHEWLKDAVKETVSLDGNPIGYHDPTTDPEEHGDLDGVLDGLLDPYAGHGTFIAGLVHQACPDADILSWRVVPGSGPLVEKDWLIALAQILELVRQHAEDPRRGQPIDVLSLSMGYYHERPDDELLDPILREIMLEFGRLGTIVVCSAGNDATARPCYPAAFAPWDDGTGSVKAEADRVPLVSVGARNPSDHTDAMFSNAGPWVRAYERGAAVMSTMPPYDAGGQPVASVTAYDRLRTCLDPDDFRGGFGVWSGTSFSAPLLAGKLAAALLPHLPEGGDADLSAKVSRGWAAVEALTDIEKPDTT
jgi:serine protease